jgi:hypothetical protein
MNDRDAVILIALQLADDHHRMVDIMNDNATDLAWVSRTIGHLIALWEGLATSVEELTGQAPSATLQAQALRMATVLGDDDD